LREAVGRFLFVEYDVDDSEEGRMLTKCPECGHDVSTTAEKCPNCGAPISSTAQGLIPEASKNVQVIEKTSKYYKAQKLYSVVLFVVGLILFGTGTSNGAKGVTTLGQLCMVISIIWGIATSIGSWWHHG